MSVVTVEESIDEIQKKKTYFERKANGENDLKLEDLDKKDPLNSSLDALIKSERPLKDTNSFDKRKIVDRKVERVKLDLNSRQIAKLAPEINTDAYFVEIRAVLIKNIYGKKDDGKKHRNERRRY